MKVKPIGDRILVQQLKQEEMTASGIVLPDSAEKEKKAQGKIVALGNGEEIKKLGLKEGDTVFYGEWAGKEIEIDREKYRILYVGSKEDHSEIIALAE